VVLGVLRIRGPGQAADTQVEPGRAVLPLVVAVRRERADLMWTVAEHVREDLVDLRVAAPALLVGQRTAVARAGQHEAVPDLLHPGRVAGEPGDRADRAGREDEPVRVVR